MTTRWRRLARSELALAAAGLIAASCSGTSATGGTPPGRRGPGLDEGSGEGAAERGGGPVRRPPGPVIADHRAADAFERIPREHVVAAARRLRIMYAHTSHGSQISTGLQMLADPPFEVNAGPGTLAFAELDGADLGVGGETHWVDTTREILAEHPEIDLVMWSWCGGVSESSAEGIRAYLESMSGLEARHPGVVFVYMTGHLDGTGPTGNLHRRNEQIRDHCRERGRVLFDFADIEMHDPSGRAHPRADDSCPWCPGWCAGHPGDCPHCDECAHSHCLSCLRKGRAFWWLLARLVGWDGGA